MTKEEYLDKKEDFIFRMMKTTNYKTYNDAKKALNRLNKRWEREQWKKNKSSN